MAYIPRSDEICVCCGKYVPEGRMVCAECERKADEQYQHIILDKNQKDSKNR